MCSRRAVRRCIFMGGKKDQLGESARVLEVPRKNLEVLQAAGLRSCGMLLLALFGQCVAFSVGFSGWNGAHALGHFDGLYPGALHSSKALSMSRSLKSAVFRLVFLSPWAARRKRGREWFADGHVSRLRQVHLWCKEAFNVYSLRTMIMKVEKLEFK